MTTKQAVDQIRKILREDAEYFYTWQADMAMSFQDEWERYAKEVVGRNACYDVRNHIANDAAKRFLNHLLHEEHDTVQDGKQGNVEEVL